MKSPSPWKISQHYSEWVVWSKPYKVRPSSERFPYVALVYKKEDAVLVQNAPELLELCKHAVEDNKVSEKWLKKVSELIRKIENAEIE